MSHAKEHSHGFQTPAKIPSSLLDKTTDSASPSFSTDTSSIGTSPLSTNSGLDDFIPIPVKNLNSKNNKIFSSRLSFKNLSLVSTDDEENYINTKNTSKTYNVKLNPKISISTTKSVIDKNEQLKDFNSNNSNIISLQSKNFKKNIKHDDNILYSDSECSSFNGDDQPFPNYNEKSYSSKEILDNSVTNDIYEDSPIDCVNSSINSLSINSSINSNNSMANKDASTPIGTQNYSSCENEPSNSNVQHKKHGDRPSSCVFVASLSASRTDEQLFASVSKLFRVWGPMKVKVLRDSANRPYAFVQYSDDADAKRALEEAHNTILDGRAIRCEPARVNRTLFLSKSNSAPINETELKDLLSPYGSIEEIVIPKAENLPSHILNGSFVKFVYRDDAIQAYSQLRFNTHWIVEWAQNLESENISLLSKKTSSTSIFIGQLDPEKITKEILIDKFSQYGKIADVKLIIRPDSANTQVKNRCPLSNVSTNVSNSENKKKNVSTANPSSASSTTSATATASSAFAFAFIRYNSESEANTAIQCANNTVFLDRTIQVQLRELNQQAIKLMEPKLAPPPLINNEIATYNQSHLKYNEFEPRDKSVSSSSRRKSKDRNRFDNRNENFKYIPSQYHNSMASVGIPLYNPEYYYPSMMPFSYVKPYVGSGVVTPPGIPYPSYPPSFYSYTQNPLPNSMAAAAAAHAAAAAAAYGPQGRQYSSPGQNTYNNGYPSTMINDNHFIPYNGNSYYGTNIMHYNQSNNVCNESYPLVYNNNYDYLYQPNCSYPSYVQPDNHYCNQSCGVENEVNSNTEE